VKCGSNKGEFMLALFGAKLPPALGILLGLVGIVAGVASHRTLLVVVGVVVLIVGGIRTVAARRQ
jgi:uncharacterized membrane protein HdeD (DUF308 family)